MKEFFKALRPYQWVKNILVFLPAILSANIFSYEIFSQLVIIFFALSFIASAGYIINDLIDVENDRKHPYKKNRLIAAGKIKPQLAKVYVFVAFSLGLLILSISWDLMTFLTLLLYFSISLVYSIDIKRRLILDIICLASLFTMRVILGAIATGLPLSLWLLAFSMFIFLCLAGVKRLAELIYNFENNADLSFGRSYVSSDIPVIQMLSLTSGYLAVLVLIFHIYEEPTKLMYSTPEYLWGICPIILYWISRIVIITHRGNMHHDPIIFTLKDRVSYICGIVTIMFAIAAKIL